MRDAQDVDVLEPAPVDNRLGGLRLTVPVAIVVVIFDLLTKEWALNRLTPGSCSQPDACIDLFAGIRFRLIFNTGIAFTRGSGLGSIWALLAMFMAGLLLVMAWRQTDRWSLVLLGMVCGGAVGNLIDRIARADDGLFSGAVVDFIDFGWWPVFNIADAAIVVGVIFLIGRSFIYGVE